jgi:hypothetical protein
VSITTANKHPRTATPFFWASIATFLISLFLPGYHCVAEQTFGGELLLIGWSVIEDGYYAWLGNPMLFVAWLLFCRKSRWTFIPAGAALLFMLEFLSHDRIPGPWSGGYSPPKDWNKILDRGSAYWTWIASALFMFPASVLVFDEKSIKRQTRR